MRRNKRPSRLHWRWHRFRCSSATSGVRLYRPLTAWEQLEQRRLLSATAGAISPVSFGFSDQQADDVAAYVAGEQTEAAVDTAFAEVAEGEPLATSWTNPEEPCDVNGDTFVSPIDALVVINTLNEIGSRELATSTDDAAPPPYYDTSGDGYVSPIDALTVINFLNDYDDDSGGDTTSISLQGDTISVDGEGAAAEGGVVTITSAGEYTISGTLNDGQVVVDTAEVGDVELVLNGVDITCSDGPAIYVANADDTLITLADGTQNFVADGAAYPHATTEEPNAAIFSKDDLTIGGGGSLTVSANFNNGITSKDDLEIAGGTIAVDAVNDGIKGRDSVTVTDGTVTVNAGGDGIQSSNDEDAGEGFVLIEGGTLDITAGEDGIQGVTSVFVSGGSVAVTAGGGSAGSGGAADSAKGIKAVTEVTINGGVIDVDSFDDAIHSNGSIAINAGDLTLATADDAIHADAAVAINGGAIRVTSCFEGIESPTISIDDATIDIDAVDDGIGAVTLDGSSTVFIYGGTLTIVSGGDGIEAEARVLITGGDIAISSGGGSTVPVGADESAKGIKSTADLTIEGGTIDVDSADDALHSNDTLTITGGSLALATYDDAIHADTAITIDGGTIDISQCYEGLESVDIAINDGEIRLVAIDDGFNVSDGSSGGVGGPLGDVVIDGSLSIHGGYIVLNAEGDGIDSNGTAEITGGTIIVHGTTSDREGALDTNGTFLMSGGFLVAVGAARMAESPDEESTQEVLAATYGTVQAGGTMLHIETEDGEDILTFVPLKNYQSFVICSPQLAAGATYVVYSGGSSTGTVADGLYTGGTYTPGTELGTLTVD